jgi:hypothetical protein
MIFRKNEKAIKEVRENYGRELFKLVNVYPSMEGKEYKQKLEELQRKTAQDILRVQYLGVPRWKIVVNRLAPLVLLMAAMYLRYLIHGKV